MALSDSSALYLYSALLQANAAVLALLAVFAVFRIQTLTSRASTMRDYLLRHGPSYQVPRQTVVEFDWADRPARLRIIEQTPNPPLEYQLAQSGASQLRRWLEADDLIEETKSSLASPIIALTALMVMATFGIVCAVGIHTYSAKLEFFLLLAFAALNSAVYVWTVRHLLRLARK